MYSGLISFSESGMVKKNHQDIQDTPVQPYLRAKREKGCVTLAYDLDSNESILLYCKRGNESDYLLLTETSKPIFEDRRPNLTEYAETREYKAQFASDGVPIGEPDFIKLKTKGRFRLF